MISFDLPETGGVYLITCVPTSKIYVGSALNLRQRCYHHFRRLRLNIHENPKLQNAFNKHGGEQAFTFEVLEFILIPEMLTAREQFWFSKLKPFDKRGFNIARVAGSSLGVKRSPETREKIRLAGLGKKNALGTKASPETIERLRQSHLGQPGYWTGKKRDPETCEKMGAGRRGKPGPNLGKKASPETIERLRQSHLGKSLPEEQRRKIGEAQRGKKMSAEAIEKTRQKNLGRKNTPEARERMSKAQQGRTLSEDHKRKIGDASRGRAMSDEARARISAGHVWHMQTLIVTSPEGETFTVQGIHKFCKEHNLSHSHLIQVARGERSHHKGWKASYPEQ